MADVSLSQITVSLIPPPSGQPRKSPPASFNQSAPLTSLQARSQASFSFGEPTFLPDGYEFIDAVHLQGDVELVIMSYEGPTGRLRLVQGPLDQYRPGKDGVRRYFVVADALQPASVGRAAAALGPKAGHLPSMPPSINLIWENGGLLAHILSQGVSQEDIERTASSIS